jgi:hypothetical protein
MSAHLTQPVPDPGMRVPSLNAKTRELIMMSMAKKRDDRFLTFAAFINAIDAARSGYSEKSGNAPRLLRKPMVIKGPVRKAPAPTVEHEDNAEKGANSATNAFSSSRVGSSSLAFATERILSKFKSHKENGEGHTSNGANAVMTKALSDTTGEKKESTPPTTKKTRKIDIPTEAIHKKESTRSAAYDEDSTESAGTGMIPWIVLIIALAVLAMYYLA